MSSVVIAGDTSGTVTLSAPSVAGTTTLTLPSTSGTVLTTASGQWITSGSNIYYTAGSVLIGQTTNANSVALAIKGSGGSDDDLTFNSNSSYSEIQSYNSKPMCLNRQGNAIVINGSSTIAGYKFTMYHTDMGGMAYKYNGTSEQNSCSFQNGNGQVGRIYTSGSNTTYSTSSDYRLKENVVPMTGALDKVAQLNPVTYTWKTDGSAGQGFIAHELQAVVPDCVGGTKDAVDADGNPVYQDIDTSFLVATLTAAIKELKAELDTVKTELAILKGAA